MAEGEATDVADPALEQLREQGYVILPELLSPAQVNDIRSELWALLEQQAWGDAGFFGSRTRRLHNLLAKTRCIDPVVTQPRVGALVRALLGLCQVSIANAIEIHPGESEQFLHQDDMIFPLGRPHPPLIVNTMWAITDFTLENGATRLLPWTQDLEQIPEGVPEVVAEMSPGSVLLWNGGLFHGGGPNRADRPRLGLNINYNCAWLRQQENAYLAIPREVARALPDDLLKLLGYDSYMDIYGLVDHRHPLGVLGREVQPIGSGGGETLGDLNENTGKARSAD